MGGLIWEQRPWSEVTARVERRIRGPQASRGHSGPAGAWERQERERCQGELCSRWLHYVSIFTPSSERGACWHSLCCSPVWFRSTVSELSSPMAQLFPEAKPPYIDLQWQKSETLYLLWKNMVRSYWMIATTLGFSDLIQELSFTSICLDILCVLSQYFSTTVTLSKF